MKKVLLSIYDWLVYRERDFCDFFTRKKIIVSVGDYMHDRGVYDCIHFIIASELLDIEAFVLKNDESFTWQKAIETSYYGGNNLDDTLRLLNFRNVILSYKQNGYNGKSYFLLDRNKMLRNGTHRTALHLFYKIYTAKAYVVNRQYPDFDELFERYQRDFPSCLFMALDSKLEQIRQQLIADGVSFCAIIPNDTSLGDTLPLIGSSIDVKKELKLNKLSKEIYTSLNLNTTFEYKIVLFTLYDPQYEVVTGLLESKKIKNIDIPKHTYISKSCYEGKKIYDALKPYFINENGVSE